MKASRSSRVFIFIQQCRIDTHHHSEQKERQRLAVPVEPDARIDSAFEHTVEHEIESVQLRQLP